MGVANFSRIPHKRRIAAIDIRQTSLLFRDVTRNLLQHLSPFLRMYQHGGRTLVIIHIGFTYFYPPIVRKREVREAMLILIWTGITRWT